MALAARLRAAYTTVVVEEGVVDDESEEEGVDDVAEEEQAVFIHWMNLTLTNIYLVLRRIIDRNYLDFTLYHLLK